MDHPHTNKRHVMESMRRYVLAVKRKRGSARSLGHYIKIIQTYLTAKRLVVREKIC